MTQFGTSSQSAVLSVVIIAQDEERTIGKVLAAAKPLAQEIILVDSGSSDRTVEIAQSLGAKIVRQDWLGYAAQKNFALGLASCEWILSLDADEVLTPDLVAEISHLLSNPDRLAKFSGFRIPRVLFIGDRPVWHGGFYPDAQLRLFRRGAGQFNDRLVHEAVFVEGPVGRLKQCFHHSAYENTKQFREAMESYARLSTKESLHSGFKPFKISCLNLWLHPVWTFLYRYVLRAGFLDGALGLKLNWAYADYVRRKILYLRQAASDNQQ